MKFQRTVTVAAGASQQINIPKDVDILPIGLQLTPVSGGTLTAYASMDSWETLHDAPANVKWTQITSVTVSTITEVNVPITAIKIEAATQAGTASVVTYSKPTF